MSGKNKGAASGGKDRSRRVFIVENPARLREICGPGHRHLQLIEQLFSDFELRAESQGGEIVLTGLGDGPKLAEETLIAFSDRLDAGMEATASSPV